LSNKLQQRGDLLLLDQQLELQLQAAEFLALQITAS